MAKFVSAVHLDVENTWRQIMPGGRYTDSRLVVFRGATQSGCGVGQSQMGPFYCPVDRNAYIDLSFYEDLRSRLGAPGDFAQAYVIAHEIGHHVQNLLGTSDMVHEAPARAQKGAGGLSVKLELQADCYAGVWAYHANKRGILETGDVEEALAAAAAIGDDRLQKQGQGSVTPETWSHGSSEQRAFWLKRGMASGDPASCYTFAAGR
jgi:predicted metalloprotease